MEERSYSHIYITRLWIVISFLQHNKKGSSLVPKQKKGFDCRFYFIMKNSKSGTENEILIKKVMAIQIVC